MNNVMLLQRIDVLEKELKDKDDEIYHFSITDRLTGLYCWDYVLDYLVRLLSARNGDGVGVLLANFDGFRVFNYAHGYKAGDMALARFGENLLRIIPKEMGLVGRFNGETFLMVAPGVTQEDLSKIRDMFYTAVCDIEIKITEPIERTIKPDLTISVGGAVWDGCSIISAKDICRMAEIAVRHAKHSGKNRFIIYQKEMESFYRDSEAEPSLVQELHSALEQGEFEPFYQPLYGVKSGAVTCAEALARWRHPKKGILTPNYFIPFMEANGLILQLDIILFEETCKNVRRWMDERLSVVPICCNFSRAHFLDPNFASNLKAIADKHQVATSYLSVEVTENILIERNDLAIRQLQQLRKYGFAVEMDDFGSGYSSFGSLQSLPIDTIKLDRIFIQRDLNDFKNTTILCAIANIGKALGMTIICEGIETSEQAAFLKTFNCDMAQGFFYARPMELTKFEGILRDIKTEAGDLHRHPNRASRFVEQVVYDYFVKQNFDQLEDDILSDAVWSDVLSGKAVGREQLKRNFEDSIRGQKLSVIFRHISPHQESQAVLVSGEAVLCDQESGESYAFYFFAGCVEQSGRIRLSKFKMDALFEDGFSAFTAPRLQEAGSFSEGATLAPFYDALPLGIIRYDMAGDMIITYMNQEMYRIIGYTPEQFMGELNGNIRTVVHPDDLDEIYQYSCRAMAGEKVAPLCYRFIQRDGTVVRVRYWQYTTQGIDGRPVAQGMYTLLDKGDCNC